MQGNVVVKSFVGISKNRLAQVLKLFIAMDTERALVTMGELAQFKELHTTVPPYFNK